MSFRSPAPRMTEPDRKGARGRPVGFSSKRLLCLLLCLLIAAGSILPGSAEDSKPSSGTPDKMGVGGAAANASPTGYVAYLEKHKDTAPAGEEFTVYAAESYTLGMFVPEQPPEEPEEAEEPGEPGEPEDADGEAEEPEPEAPPETGPINPAEVEIYPRGQIEGSLADGLYIGEEGAVSFTVNIPKTGMYSIRMRYYTEGGKAGRIEKRLAVNGKKAFDESEFLIFDRVFRDQAKDKPKDINGNDIRPLQVEIKTWIEAPFRDSIGYFPEPLLFYFEEGENILTLTSVREPILIESFTFYNETPAPSYEEVKAGYAASGYKPADAEIFIQQAEQPLRKNEKSNYPVSDRSSSATQPQDIYHIIHNTLGGPKWANMGSWVDWEFTPEASGLYTINLRCRQNVNSGAESYRKLTIDGELPFAEAASLPFRYSTDWKSVTLGDGEQDYEFYFESGRTYIIRLESVLGAMNDVLRRVQDVVSSLNACYLKILMMTGPNPDAWRDYKFDKLIPDVLEEMGVQANELLAISNEIQRLSGEKGERVAQLETLQYMVQRMVDRPREIARRFNMFKDNVAAMGTWILNSSAQPLEADYLAFVPADQPAPEPNFGFFKNFVFGLQSFFASFVIDYQSVGAVEETDTNSAITVWISSGRDQATITRDLIDSKFTPETGISVNLQLVTGGTIMPSVLAKRGPDVSLGMGMGDPINYAIRNAVKDVGHFPDYEEVVTSRFKESAVVPFAYMGKTYALPETQSFNMLFYRTDIFEQLDLTVPRTWYELEQTAKELQKKNMEIGIPHDLNALLMMMYQRGLELYREDGKYANLDRQDAVLAFAQMMDYFTLYKFPTEFDFANRFRNGQMPLAIVDYTTYNQMTLFAPEIRGKWAMAPLPGTPGPNYPEDPEDINNASTSGGSAVCMLRDCEDEQSAWEFMKWWTSAEIQAT
ncbi:MAG: extracellular solute-binding protein, partial [Oscillospiraceae bacterium]|nr:extracellular solute-binding protein [Oscillospiraceae bacterium]